VRTLWRDTPATFNGRFTRFTSVSIDPKTHPAASADLDRRPAPTRRSPGPAARGDGWVSYVVQADRYAQSLDKIRAAAADAGRSLDGFTAAHLAFITVGARLRGREEGVGERAEQNGTTRTSSRS